MKSNLFMKRKLEIGLTLLIGMSAFWGCNNDLAPIRQNQALPPDLSKHSVFESFSPDSGGIGLPSAPTAPETVQRRSGTETVTVSPGVPVPKTAMGFPRWSSIWSVKMVAHCIIMDSPRIVMVL